MAFIYSTGQRSSLSLQSKNATGSYFQFSYKVSKAIESTQTHCQKAETSE